MNTNLSSTVLGTLLGLAEKREELTRELTAVEREIEAAMISSPRKKVVPKKRKGGMAGNGKTKKAPTKAGKRGAVKNRVLAALETAGDAGIAVKDLSANLGIKPQNLHVWFNITGKKSGLVEALGKGVYRLRASGISKIPSKASEKNPPKASGNARKKK